MSSSIPLKIQSKCAAKEVVFLGSSPSFFSPHALLILCYVSHDVHVCFLKIIFILTVLGLVAARGLSPVVACRLLTAVASLVGDHRTQEHGLQGLQQVGSVVHPAHWLQLMGSKARAQCLQYTGLVAL